MRKIGLLIIFYLMFAYTHAQILSGTIENENGESLPGATIHLENTFLSTLSDTKGYFEFKHLKAGKYNVSVSYLGYNQVIKELETDNSNVNVKIIMQVSENLTDEVIVHALRAGKKAPIASTEINKEDIQKNNLGQDVPYLLNLLPSITTSSDAGTGIGYAKLSVRGTDLTRINVTVNGIPLNDAESHGVYWVDLPDLASSVENIQVQRGVGSSTNGAAAFGANINFMTNQLQKEAYSKLAASYGSFDSYKTSINAGTGLINKHFAFDLRLSKIHSDGFIDRSITDMESFYSSGSYTDSKTLIKLNILSGSEETYQAWNGIPKVRLENDPEGMQRYQNHWLYTEEETLHMLNSDSRTFNLYTYKNEVDNYKQSHYQIFMSHELNRNLQINLAFNYTKGKGYYEQYKKDENLSDYLIEPVIIGIDTLNSTDLIRRKWLDNELFVLNYSLDYNRDKIKAIIGGSIQNYFGKHYGNIVWARYAGDSEIDHQWYYNAGDKFEYNVYGKFEYLFLNKFNFYADLQFRQINYKILGMDENLRDLSQTHTFGFFNPKFGINYSIVDNQKAYFSFGVANREPSRTDFKDAIAGTEPKNETLNDFELGYTYTGQNIYFNLNFYYMNYRDQLVRTGKINDVGEAIFTNAPISFRKGIEVNSAVKLTKLLDWKFNATISSNKIKEYTEFIDNWDEGGQNENYIGESNLSFSPWLIVGNEFEINLTGGFRLAIQSKYVSKQYIDNSSTSDRMLDAYIVNNLRLNYHFETKYLKSIDLQFIINNLLNEAYETDAWVYRYYYENAYYNMDGYFPQAGRNFMVGMVLNF